MAEPKPELDVTRLRTQIVHAPPSVITPKLVGMASLVMISLIFAAVFLVVDDKFRLTMIAIPPAVLVGIWIMRNPFVGVYLFFLYSMLRPYDFIPALRPLRLAMVIEIVTLISWLFYLMRTKARVVWSPLNMGFLGLLTVMGLGIVIAKNPYMALDFWEQIAITFVMFIIAINVVDSLKKLTQLMWLMLFIFLYFGIKGIYNFEVLHTVVKGVAASGRVGSGYIGDENDFALALNIWIPTAFFMFLYLKKIQYKLLSMLFLGTFVWGVVASMSRGGWIGLVAVFAYCIFNSKYRIRSIGYAALVAVGFFMVAPPQYYSEISTVTDMGESTADERIRSWKAALHIFADHPVFGVGPGNGGFYLPEYIKGTNNPDRMWGRAFHGTVPQVLAELGVLGSGVYFWMIIHLVRRMRRLQKIPTQTEEGAHIVFLANSLVGAIVGYFVPATFLSTLFYPQLWLLLTFSAILLQIAETEYYNKQTEVPMESSTPVTPVPFASESTA